VLSLTTTNSTFDTLLAVYVGTRVTNLTLIAANDDAFDASRFSALSVAVRAGQDYRIVVDGFDGASGAVFLRYTLTPNQVYNLTVNTTPGGTVAPGSGVVAANSMVILTASPQVNFDFTGWTGSAVASTNPLMVMATGDLNVTAQFSPHPFTDGFESGGFATLPWTFGGDAPWTVQTDSVASGVSAARSGQISDGQSSILRLTVNSVGGVASFDYRVSSEPVWDTLGFYLNGVLVQSWSGEVAWAKYQFPIPAGTVNLEWRYTKDASRSAGLDAAFIDSFDLPSANSTPASIQLKSVAAGTFQIQFQGLSNQPYRVQASPDLQVWQTISSNVVSASPVTFTDLAPATSAARCYRVVSP
jgi:uncharacterized repeat protein (TIGR02543 family)